MTKAHSGASDPVAVPTYVPDDIAETIPSEVQEAIVLDVVVSSQPETPASEAGMFDAVPCRTDEPAVRLRRRIRRHASLDNNPSSG